MSFSVKLKLPGSNVGIFEPELRTFEPFFASHMTCQMKITRLKSQLDVNGSIHIKDQNWKVDISLSNPAAVVDCDVAMQEKGQQICTQPNSVTFSGVFESTVTLHVTPHYVFEGASENEKKSISFL